MSILNIIFFKPLFFGKRIEEVLLFLYTVEREVGHISALSVIRRTFLLASIWEGGFNPRRVTGQASSSALRGAY